MARKRMIDPGIWQSEDFSKLSTLAKLVFIGLFSLADDEGRGRCNPVYLKSTLFPYEEGIRSADIDKTLSEISSNMSVILYSCDGSNYYSLYNWDTWQKIDKPTPSKIPDFDEKNCIRLLFDEGSTNVRRGVALNRIEKNIKEKEKEEKKKSFEPPTLDEIRKYIQEKSLNVNPEKFFNYFSEGNWIDSKGVKVKNWKQKLLTWNGYSNSLKTRQSQPSNKFFDTKTGQYDDLDSYINNGLRYS